MHTPVIDSMCSLARQRSGSPRLHPPPTRPSPTHLPTHSISLQELWLYSNELESVPPELGKLTGLKRLWLDRNRLTALPPQLANLAQLQVWKDGPEAVCHCTAAAAALLFFIAATVGRVLLRGGRSHGLSPSADDKYDGMIKAWLKGRPVQQDCPRRPTYSPPNRMVYPKPPTRPPPFVGAVCGPERHPGPAPRDRPAPGAAQAVHQPGGGRPPGRGPAAGAAGAGHWWRRRAALAAPGGRGGAGERAVQVNGRGGLEGFSWSPRWLERE